MEQTPDVTVTRLLVAALDSAGVGDRTWHTRFKITPARLARIRSGQALLTDADLNRISLATGEPWQNLVVGLIGEENQLTADTRELLSSLHSLKQTAETEAAQRGKRPRQFQSLRRLLQKKSS